MVGNSSSQSNETAHFGGQSEGERAAGNYLAAPAQGQENAEGSDNASVNSIMTTAVSQMARQRGVGAPAPMAIAMPASNGGSASAGGCRNPCVP